MEMVAGYSLTGFIVAAFIALLFLYYWMRLKRPFGFPPGPPSLPLVCGLYAQGLDTTMIPWRYVKLVKTWVVVLNDLSSVREAFVQRGNDAAGRPYKDHFKVVSSNINPHYPKAGIALNEFDDQLKVQRNISMVVLRNLGYGKKSIEHKVCLEMQHLIDAIKVDILWFVKYLPVVKKWLKTFEKACAKSNDYFDKRVKELSEDRTGFNFVSLYLNEVEKDNSNGGTIENRVMQLVQDFYAAGAETTATTLGWALYFMIKYNDVQTKVRVMGNLLSVLHDPATFPQPDLFKPERFLDSNGEFVRHDSFIPFRVGRKSCLGEQLARQELFLFFTHLIQSFEFKLPEGKTLPPQKGL